ncbi:heavy-metal-associated domain-containing protein [Streptomyces sp. NBC_00160]|uniref:heavy-metal-associated domain-containing protein n=1 Tax=Streptomyces sp. NBC_00160 TaxID=2903628 RepID=UPI002250E513|nr:heavy metal-associated domain-containing protein [Streptomyces sp. NBC_00160]MCX5302721.1 heavy-metal-associated domain-containing protein [Streptomyces sp. NBC_00160]
MKLFGRKQKDDTETGPLVVLEVEGMHCTSCGLLIDDELEEIPGVRSASTDLRSGRSTIRLEEGAEIDTAVLVAAVENAGDYKARPAA